MNNSIAGRRAKKFYIRVERFSFWCFLFMINVLIPISIAVALIGLIIVIITLLNP